MGGQSSKVGHDHIGSDTCFRRKPGCRQTARPCDPSAPQSEPLCRNVIMVKALRDVQDLRRRHAQPAQSFMKVGLSGLITLELLGCNYVSKFDVQALLRLGEQRVVSVRKDGQWKML